jgi:alkanesulfonate monooxygenase SsuD/methylene tetrahydromethanopterin reductase-like flavin-dependent oxidoreductase (luciferase family)
MKYGFVLPTGDAGIAAEFAFVAEQSGWDGFFVYETIWGVDAWVSLTASTMRTTRIKLGTMISPLSRMRPWKIASEAATLDQLSQGRIIVGLGRGTAYNFYEYRGYGIDPHEAHARLLEAEEILMKVWTARDYTHLGTYWQLQLPELRPQVYQQPHPPIVRACSGLDSTLEMARQGRPFLMNIQSDAVTQQRLDLYRQTMAEVGYNDDTITRTVENCWAWRNIVVADTDAEAAAVGVPAFRRMREHLNSARRRLNLPEEQQPMSSSTPAARETVEHGLIYGSPATVCDKLEVLRKIGIGGLILHFRLGPMPWDVTEHSLRLFADKVAPELRTSVAG